MRIVITGSTGLGKVVADAFSDHELILISRNVTSDKHRCINLDCGGLGRGGLGVGTRS